ncbi:MAG: FosX/FosE/FosI family fosfomycin resistance hydrolase [Patescibacteria group bacterium]
MIKGISHITYIVQDLKKSTNFFSKIFDAKEVYSSGDATFSLSREKFFLINNIWIAIMEGKSLNKKTYNHVAFKVSKKDFGIYEQRIRKLDIEIKEARSRVNGEAQSIYFYDYDNHLFEIHTGTLKERLHKYKS